MKTVILCGGRGTRIRGVDEALPKPMISVGDKPILRHIIDIYVEFGFWDFILCLGYKSETIVEYFRQNGKMLSESQSVQQFEVVGPSKSTCRITLVETGLETMTGGRLSRVRHLLDSEHFFLTYGDGVSDVDLIALRANHLNSGAVMTLTAVHPPARFGDVRFLPSGLVTSFNEKPQTSEGRISGGFFVCSPEIFEYVNSDDGVMLETEPMRRLVQDKKLRVFLHNGFWQCMDTYRDWELLNGYVRNGTIPWIRK
jgi:glucose-1-phosphate cytidylyltransferase